MLQSSQGNNVSVGPALACVTLFGTTTILLTMVLILIWEEHITVCHHEKRVVFVLMTSYGWKPRVCRQGQ